LDFIFFDLCFFLGDLPFPVFGDFSLFPFEFFLPCLECLSDFSLFLSLDFDFSPFERFLDLGDLVFLDCLSFGELV
jgi:hypothetical protein